MITYGKKESQLLLIGKVSDDHLNDIYEDFEILWQLKNTDPITIVNIVLHMGLTGIPLWRLETLIEGYKITKQEFFYESRNLGINISESNQSPRYAGIIIRPDKRWVAHANSYVRAAVEVLRKFERETLET